MFRNAQRSLRASASKIDCSENILDVKNSSPIWHPHGGGNRSVVLMPGPWEWGILFKKSMVKYLEDDSGAVTVDWVVLTAAVVGLGLIVFAVVIPAVESLSSYINEILYQRAACLSVAAEGWGC